ncbi:11298_t:CDS:2 [Rhizophagus irregularis]|nr:11298_t:CDS:2 [Rhizophagus irregularis]
MSNYSAGEIINMMIIKCMGVQEIEEILEAKPEVAVVVVVKEQPWQ